MYRNTEIGYDLFSNNMYCLQPKLVFTELKVSPIKIQFCMTDTF